MITSHYVAAFLSFALCCGQLVVGQQVWKVSSTLSHGAQFADLPAAVAAAAPGDTIWVYSVVGTSAWYTAPVIDKPLTIVGFKVGGIPGSNNPSVVGLVGELTIANIQAGARVVMSNFIMTSQTPAPSTVLISDCAGAIVIDDLTWRALGLADRTVRIVNSANVTLRGCEFRLGGESLDIINSKVLATNCRIDHDSPAPWPFPGYTTTSETIFLQNSRLTLAGSIVTALSEYSAYNQPSRHAVVLDNSTLRVSPTTLVRGGYITGTPGTAPSHFIPACLLTGTGTNEVQHDPRAPATNYGPVQPTVTWQHEVIHDWVVADEQFHVQASGPYQGFLLLALGDYVPWSQQQVPGAPISGQLALDPLTAYAIDLVPIGSGLGTYDWTFLCPALAANGHAFALQGLTLSPSGEFGWTIPSPLTVGWDKDRIP